MLLLKIIVIGVVVLVIVGFIYFLLKKIGKLNDENVVQKSLLNIFESEKAETEPEDPEVILAEQKLKAANIEKKAADTNLSNSDNSLKAAQVNHQAVSLEGHTIGYMIGNAKNVTEHLLLAKKKATKALNDIINIKTGNALKICQAITELRFSGISAKDGMKYLDIPEEENPLMKKEERLSFLQMICKRFKKNRFSFVTQCFLIIVSSFIIIQMFI